MKHKKLDRGILELGVLATLSFDIATRASSATFALACAGGLSLGLARTPVESVLGSRSHKQKKSVVNTGQKQVGGERLGVDEESPIPCANVKGPAHHHKDAS